MKRTEDEDNVSISVKYEYDITVMPVKYYMDITAVYRYLVLLVIMSSWQTLFFRRTDEGI